MHDKAQIQNAEVFQARFSEVADQRQKALRRNEGESLSLDDLSEIYIQVKGEEREAAKLSLNTRDKKGDISDYLETRRPFGSGQ